MKLINTDLEFILQFSTHGQVPLYFSKNTICMNVCMNIYYSYRRSITRSCQKFIDNSLSTFKFSQQNDIIDVKWRQWFHSNAPWMQRGTLTRFKGWCRNFAKRTLWERNTKMAYARDCYQLGQHYCFSRYLRMATAYGFIKRHVSVFCASKH